MKQGYIKGWKTYNENPKTSSAGDNPYKEGGKQYTYWEKGFISAMVADIHHGKPKRRPEKSF